MNRRMPAFAASAAPVRAVPSFGRAVCAGTPRPAFFASQAFGAPVAAPARIAPPPTAGAGAVRMDVTIVVGDSEPIESAIRRFKKEVTKSGHLYELRRRRYFETNTEKRLRKAAGAKRKARLARNMKRRQVKRPTTTPTESKEGAPASTDPATATAPTTVAAPAPVTL